MTDWNMGREIAEQPQMLRRCAKAWQARALELRPRIKGRQLVLVGRGSSGNACTFAAYLDGLHSGRAPIELRPWIVTQEVPRADWSDTTALVFSLSGESTDVAMTAGWLRDRGAHVIGVTNAERPDCRLGTASDELFHLGIGPERAVPATKSYCAQLVTAAALCGFPIEEAAEEIAQAIEALLVPDALTPVVDFLAEARTVVWIARGPALAAALDAALKLQETAAMPALAWSAAEYFHGPIRAAAAEDRVVLLADTEEPLDSVQAVATTLIGRGTPFLRVGPRSPTRVDVLSLQMPKERWARTPILAMLSQKVALSLAERRGLDPDAPAGIQKITMT